MDNSLLAVALLALATVLIVAEIFVPSAGLLAVGMLVSLAASFYFAWSAWWSTSPFNFLVFVGFAIVFIPGVGIAAVSLLPHTRLGKRILLQGPTEAEVVPFAKEEARLNSYKGRHGRAITPLSPGGLISIDRERIHAYSEGVIIERDATVEIIRATGTRVLVREVKPEAIPAAKPASHADSPDTDTAVADADAELDFELPEV